MRNGTGAPLPRKWAVRILIRPRLPVLALLLLAPAIPELLTGSTPVSEIAFNPAGFGIGFALDVALYGTGALLIREFAATFRKGWGSILLLGGAYGIAEEGFEVHTFFQPSGNPVGALGSYGHLWGVNWLWALALTIFHATYSIALPILLTRLWFPRVRDERWLAPGAVALLAIVFATEVICFGLLIGHGPSPAALALFLAIVAVLVTLAYRVPREFLLPLPGARKIGNKSLVLLGAVEFAAYGLILLLAATQVLPAVGAAGILLLANGGVILVIRRSVGTEGIERSEFLFAVGMLSALFVWDGLIEFIAVPGILIVSAIFIYLLLRLDRVLKRRASPPAEAPPGPTRAPPAP